ncbi:MAG: sensor- diguanylate cyclase/phosphodiesterase [Clostridia bacterium]|nr:sensor- diguanylate cyclase/phosphodiesterase [Clostridia bacterium]
MKEREPIIEELHTDSVWSKLVRILNISENYDPWRIALRISLIYLLLGVIWILLSDKIVEWFVRNKQMIVVISMIKGWFYVGITASLIFFLIYSVLRRIKVIEKELRGKNEELSAIYEELVASEEELRWQLDEILNHQEKLKTSEERFRLALQGSNDLIWDIDFISHQHYFSERWGDFLGYGSEEFPKSFEDLANFLHPDDIQPLEKATNDYFEGKSSFYSCEHRLLTKDGIYKWFYSRGKALRDASGKIIRFAGSLSDITETKENALKLQNSYEELEATYEELYGTQEELTRQNMALHDYQKSLHQMAYYDHLTGLPNRLHLYENLTHQLKNFPDRQKALLFIDLDNFKFINDTLGHAVGDELISNIGSRLKNLLITEHIISRLGGDEFIICLYQYTDLDDVQEASKKIIQCLDQPFKIRNSTLHVTMSIGIALYPQHGTTSDELLKNADIAMYKAKARGKNRYVVYDNEMNASIKERMLIEENLRTALSHDEFRVYYQPQVDTKTQQICGFEALIRWQNKDLGVVPPLKFIPIAEETHLIIPIGHWVLKQACSFLKTLYDQGFSALTMSVNISMLQLVQEDFIESVMSILQLTGLPPHYLELEITESILMESYEAISLKLHQLRLAGIQIALDDFGQGYSSLSYLKRYLKRLPINTLKIDKLFIDNIGLSAAENELADVIVMIGRRMGLTVLAEGVETKEQLDYLKHHQCDKIQGYYFSEALPEEEAVALLQKR